MISPHIVGTADHRADPALGDPAVFADDPLLGPLNAFLSAHLHHRPHFDTANLASGIPAAISRAASIPAAEIKMKPPTTSFVSA
jgi:hypothetical protein